MANINFKNPFKVFLIATAVILLILSFFIIKPFILTLISSAILADLFYPVYKKINSKLKNPSISSLLMILILVIIIAIPSYFLVDGLMTESRQVIKIASTLQLPPSISKILTETLKISSGFLADKASEFILSVPRLLLSFFILLFSFYYFLKEGPSILKSFKDFLPLQSKEKDFIEHETKKIASGIIYGMLLAGLIQGIIAFIGFYIFGVSSPILWAVGIFILSIIPGLGNFLIWLPLAAVKLFTGHPMAGIGIVVTGLIISAVELLLKPRWMGKRTNIHPLLILLGVLGGLALFGFIGMILGPLILNLSVPFIHVFVLKKKH